MTEAAPVPAHEPTLVTIGDVAVSQSWVVTPSGTKASREVSWTATPMYQSSQGIPTWAIVCAVVFFLFCFLGLLFLLAKEDKTTGSVQITVQGPSFLHTCYVPVTSMQQVQDVFARVDYARSLAASAR